MKFVKWATAVVLVSACGCSSSSPSSSPVAPTPSIVTPLPRLAGLVRVAGVPVSGATVALLKGNGLTASVVTDGGGTYSFSRVENVSFSGALVSTSKPEYFTDTKYILMSQDQTLDFDLERAMHISVGDVIQSLLGEARCASLGYGGSGGALCRRLAVTVPSGGTLEVTLSASGSSFDVSVLRPDGSIAAYTSGPSPLRATVPVEANRTYQVDVAGGWSPVREFELATILR